jgi:type II secretory pathway pseudopilin PulG
MNIQKRTNHQQALTVLELMVVVVIVAVLVALMLPMQSRSDRKLLRIHCMNNVKQVGLALGTFQRDFGSYPMQYRTNGFDGPAHASDKQMFIYFQSLSNELTNPKLLICAEDKQRNPATNFSTDFSSDKISYFAGLDADASKPGSLLAGDRNIVTGMPPKNGVLEITPAQLANPSNSSVAWTREIHENAGNVVFPDSHIEHLTSVKLRQVLRDSGLATNRLVLP